MLSNAGQRCLTTAVTGRHFGMNFARVRAHHGAGAGGRAGHRRALEQHDAEGGHQPRCPPSARLCMQAFLRFRPCESQLLTSIPRAYSVNMCSGILTVLGQPCQPGHIGPNIGVGRRQRPPGQRQLERTRACLRSTTTPVYLSGARAFGGARCADRLSLLGPPLDPSCN